jgi:NADH-quinone oxidoreductase subunit H
MSAWENPTGDIMALNDWINYADYSDLQNFAYYPYETHNIVYEIGYNLYQFLGGLVAWLIDVIFPGNGLSTWLMSGPVVNLFAVIIVALLIFLIIFTGVLVSLWQERKTLGRFMDRRGTQIGLKGFLQCVADGFKTFMKENTVPKKVDHMAYMWTLSLVIGTSVLVACMLPLSDRFFIVNYDSGFLIVMAIYALAPLFILVSGWAQNNKYSLIGGMRAAQSMISYEIPMLITVCAVAILAGTFNIGGVVAAQHESTWFIIPLFLGFLVFFTCSCAEAERTPFDLAESESELVEGWQTEYAGMKWGLIMLGDYLRGFASCAMISLLFLGGWNIAPFVPDNINAILPEAVQLLKGWFVFFLMIWVRAALPRVRIDQILNLGWKVLTPLAIVNLGIAVVLKMGGFF